LFLLITNNDSLVDTNKQISGMLLVNDARLASTNHLQIASLVRTLRRAAKPNIVTEDRFNKNSLMP
jgi:hypothetical protein